MHLGIDFGTTRTIVATVDRGNYPVVTFGDAEGDRREHFPSVAGLVGDRLVFGFEAARPAFNRTMAGLPISFGWIALSVPVGAIFSAVFAIEAWWRLIHAEKDVDPLDDPVLYQPDDVVVIKGEV